MAAAINAVKSKAAQTKNNFKPWLFSASSVSSLKYSLAFCLGTTLALIPGYPRLWDSPFSLSDSVYYTLLTGAGNTLGGCNRLVFRRLYSAIVCGVISYVILTALHAHRVVQAFIWALLTFIIEYLGRRLPIFGGALFAHTASIYAVDNTYRFEQGFTLRPLRDLLMAWAFGVACSLAVNHLVFPRPAHYALVSQFRRTFNDFAIAFDYLFTDNEVPFSGQALHDMLSRDIAVIKGHLAECDWEIPFARGNLAQRTKACNNIVKLASILAVACLEGRLLEPLGTEIGGIPRSILPQLVQEYNAALASIRAILDDHHQAVNDPPAFSIQDLHGPSDRLAKALVTTLRNAKHASVPRLIEFEKASHCLGLPKPISELLIDIYENIQEMQLQPFRFHADLLRTTLHGAVDTLRYIPSKFAYKAPTSTVEDDFYPTPSIVQRVVKFVQTDAFWGAFKVTSALTCLLAILWSPSSRATFIDYGFRNATVPLILALGNTFGSAVLTWFAQLTGAIGGASFGAFDMWIWSGVGGAVYNAPGVIFLQFLFALCFSYRLAWNVDDMLAVQILGAVGLFINNQYQPRHDPNRQDLKTHFQYWLVTLCVALGLAIPFQLLIQRMNSRKVVREGMANTMDSISKIILRISTLFSVMLSQDGEEAHQRHSKDIVTLQADVQGCQAELSNAISGLHAAALETFLHDGFRRWRAEVQIALLQRLIATCDIALQLAVVGPYTPQIRKMAHPPMIPAIEQFGAALSRDLWCQSAALSLLRHLPPALGSLNDPYQTWMSHVEQCAHCAESSISGESSERQNHDLRRFWQTIQLFMTQKRTIERLKEVFEFQHPSQLEDVQSEKGKIDPVIMEKETNYELPKEIV